MTPRCASLLLTGLVSLVWTSTSGPLPLRDAKADTCTSITDAAGLANIRRNLAGAYCLANDIDLGGIAGLEPIGRPSHPFTGSLNGQGHVIRNLTIASSRRSIGLFGLIDSGTVSNLTLAGVTITSTDNGRFAGGIVGFLAGTAAITNVRVTGSVACLQKFCRLGGVVGEATDGTIIENTSTNVDVKGGNGGAAGGIAGQTAGEVMTSYATGPTACRSNCAAGGLVGWVKDDTGAITQSFASGPVTIKDDGIAGGAVGYQGGTVTQTYSTGTTRVKASSVAAFAGSFSGPSTEVFGAGRVAAGAGALTGGLSAELGENVPAISSYWDQTTTRQTTSVRGVAQTTTQLQADKPAGFGSVWGISKGFSYPYLDFLDDGMFASTLASTVFGRRVFTFVPIGQLETTEYIDTPAHPDMASLATVYTMIARGIGLTKGAAAPLGTTKIDQYFWDDSTQNANWTGPVTDHAQLGTLQAIADNAPIDDSNILGALKARQTVIIRGTYNSGAATHWMLATLFTADSGGTPTYLVANDPFTGQQLRIDLTTKQVALPAGFPLADFKVNGYQPVTLTGAPAP